MIQEPQSSQQFTQTPTTTPQFYRQTIPQPQTHQQYRHCKDLSTATGNTVTVTELGTLTPNLTIPIAINSQVHQRIVLITTPKNRTQAQSQTQSQQVPRTRYIRVPFIPRSQQRVTTPILARSAKRAPPPFLTRSEKRAPFLESSANRVPFLISSENRVPFLARSEPITLLVKKNSLPPNVTVKTQRPTTAVYHGQNTAQIPYSQTVTNTDYQFTNSLAAPVQTTTAPLTLATMAGIQLTGADEAYADMSGAMPATVEEINVPVFIDEYLQQSAPTSTTTTAEPAAATNTNNNHNSNSSNNGYGNDNCIEDEDDDGTFENFDFDIGMIEEEEEQQQQQQQMYLCHTNTNSNSSSNNMSHYSSNDNNYNNSINSNNNISNTLKHEVKNEDDFPLEQQFLVAPNTNNCDDFFNEDTFGGGDFQPHDLNAFPTEDAVDISHFANEELSFSDYMHSSQHNPMLSETISISTNNSQALFTNAEPILPDYDQEYEQFETNGKLSQQSQTSLMAIPTYAAAGELCTVVKMEMGMDMVQQGGSSGSLKRLAAGEQTSQTMAEKRRKLHKLHLNTSLRSMEPVIKTPDVINIISEMSNDEHKMRSTKNEIINELLNCSNSSFQSVTAEIYGQLINGDAIITTTDTASLVGGSDLNTSCYDDDEDLIDVDESSPCTPHSYTSSYSHTNHTASHDSPHSPALSIASTSASNSRKKRGRPSKQHSDRPDPEKLRKLSEIERKKLEDRAKNNEASRQSRLKNKIREEEEMEEEKHLNVANAKLNAEMDELDRMIEKLKRALRRMQFPATHMRAQ